MIKDKKKISKDKASNILLILIQMMRPITEEVAFHSMIY
jgi:hypothetical protein